MSGTDETTKKQEYDPMESSQDWIEKIKDDWDYQKKLVIFEDADGNRVTPTTTTTTTTTTQRPVTTKPPSTFSPVVNITDTITQGPHTGGVAKADSTEIIKIVGITCGSIVAFILFVACVIFMCRRSTRKKNKRISIRRPLNSAEPEVDHIYAEIEPLQLPRSNSPGGASGTSANVRLPHKKPHKRRVGVSSFRAISTRIYRFFNMDTDEQSVFYHDSSESASIRGATGGVPEPPQRNTNGRRKRGRVQRGESTASRRPLLDGESVNRSSGGSEMRSNIYNPLMKEAGQERQSGPYDHLALTKTHAGHIKDPEPESPHDYFTLDQEARKRSSEEVDQSGLCEAGLLTADHDVDHMDTITEDDECVDTPKHDYFVLEPHQREGPSVTDRNNSPSKASVKSNKSSVKSTLADSPVKVKPTAKPRNIAASGSEIPENSSKVNEAGDGDSSEKNNEKEEEYVLSKLGDAPVPPAQSSVEPDIEDGGVDEYLTPKDVQKTAEYVDVLPNPPPRSVSLMHDEDPQHNSQSPTHKHSPTHKSSLTRKTPPSSSNSSPSKHSLPRTSPTKHHSPVKQVNSTSTTSDV